MPVSLAEYANPRWVKMRTRYPWVEDKNYNYKNMTIRPGTFLARYQTDHVNVRDDGWKAPGYEANHDSVTIERVNTRVDTTLKGRRPY